MSRTVTVLVVSMLGCVLGLLALLALFGLWLFAPVFSGGASAAASYDLEKLRQEGDAIVAAMKQYEVDTGEKLRRDLTKLSPKYLPTPPKQGNRPGTWQMGAGYMFKETDTICIIFLLRDTDAVYEYYVYEDGKGWKVLKSYKS